MLSWEQGPRYFSVRGLFCLAWMVNPVSPRAAGECEQVCLCRGGSQRVLLAASLRVGGARRGARPDSRLFAQILFQSPPPRPAPAPVVFPSSPAAGSCHCLGHLSQRTPSGLHGSGFSALCSFCSLCPCFISVLPFRLQLVTCVFLGSRYSWSLGGGLPGSSFSRPGLIGQGREDGPGRSALSPKCQMTHHLNQIILCS